MLLIHAVQLKQYVCRFHAHAGSLLPNGKIFVISEYTNTDKNNSTELYNPSTDTWAVIGNMNSKREEFTESLLPDGRVLIAGGFDGYAATIGAELY